MEVRVAAGAHRVVRVSQDLHAWRDLRFRIACVSETHDVPMQLLRQMHRNMAKLAKKVLMKEKDVGFRHTY